MSARYRRSEEMLARALDSIPLGSQTFSKSFTQYPKGVSPFFITRGRGSRVWDVDENEYVDFVNGLSPVVSIDQKTGAGWPIYQRLRC